ncbi:hypothetical protein [Natrialba aegyptia]|uniref:Uncharacterized protein n=1 Tax=Natrialba aegyptia DSM 13077 TaxID=1227491 RepID=M0BDR1_9EURY|nr:hypothetical protein [Natrialba aegyptia]ELZ09011.1 hypothetical protein C480_02638 [Natrialba aegyptia DSM 13077]
MNNIRSIDLDNPLLYILTMIITWIVVAGVFETVFADGNWTNAISQGIVGGLVFGVAMYYLIQYTGN